MMNVPAQSDSKANSMQKPRVLLFCPTDGRSSIKSKREEWIRQA
jgi:hypothetical protein